MADICFVCREKVTWHDDYEWFGLDGDKIHKKCAPKVDVKKFAIDNMTDEKFSQWVKAMEQILIDAAENKNIKGL